MTDPPELNPTDLDCILSAYTLNVFSSDRLPGMAASLLEAGHDTPSLRLLAGLERDQSRTASELLLRALQELGRTLPTEDAAARYWARRLADSILNGSRSPLEGARQIHQTCGWRIDPLPDQIGPFIYILDMWDEGQVIVQEFDAEVIRLAKELVDQ